MVFGACDCSDGVNHRGDGGNGQDDGGGNNNGGDGGGNNGGDGGDNGGDGGDNNGDGGGTSCQTVCGPNDCGSFDNGCGQMLDCIATCEGDTSCVAATHRCECVPMDVATVCAGHCGSVPRGCGMVADCDEAGSGGTPCSGGTTCGAGNVCTAGGVDAGPCVLNTCAGLGHTCGLWPAVASGNCGNVPPLNCYPGGGTSCSAGNYCTQDGNGDFSCQAPQATCMGTLCNQLPTTCGVGNPTTLSGTVTTPGRSIGGGNFVNRIAVPNAIVYIPASPVATTPLPAIFEGVQSGNAASCGRCTDEKFVENGQSVLAAGITNYRGEFTLSGRIPHNVAFDIVIKAGKWRRVVNIPAHASSLDCTALTLTAEQTRLNASTSDGAAGTHLPHVAVSTGYVDAMECVLWNVGIAESEFTAPSGAGRVHLYRGASGGGARASSGCTGRVGGGGGGATCLGNTSWSGNAHNCSDSRSGTANYGCVNGRDGCYWSNGTACPTYGNGSCSAPSASCFDTDASVSAGNLYDTQAHVNAYDMVVWDCEGGEHQHDGTPESNIVSYVNNGGRMFASHYAYSWIEGNGTLGMSADWGVGSTDDLGRGRVSMPITMPANPTQRSRANATKAPLFRDWLDYNGALYGTTAGLPLENPASPEFGIRDPRDRAGANAGASTDEWVYRIRTRCSNNSDRSCSTNADCQSGGTCGTSGSTAAIQQLSFNTPYGAAETAACGRVAYSGFHVAIDAAGASIDNSGDTDFFPAVCPNVALRPQELVLVFMLFDLNSCVSAGDPAVPPVCTPATAASLCPTEDSACGQLSDGCGGIVDCGGCSANHYCASNQCVPYTPCVAQTCSELGYTCGQQSDGCGGIAAPGSCGTCPGGSYCGNDGQCHTGSCTPNPDPCMGGTYMCGQRCDPCSNVCVNCGDCNVAGGEFCNTSNPNKSTCSQLD